MKGKQEKSRKTEVTAKERRLKKERKVNKKKVVLMPEMLTENIEKNHTFPLFLKKRRKG
jgi:hypothetical protein